MVKERRPGRVQVIQGVAQQVGEHLLERGGVAPGRRQRADGHARPLAGNGAVQRLACILWYGRFDSK